MIQIDIKRSLLPITQARDDNTNNPFGAMTVRSLANARDDKEIGGV